MLAECGNAMPRPPPSAATQVLHLPAHDTGQSSKGTLVESALDDNCADDAAYGQPIARSADASAANIAVKHKGHNKADRKP
jgi:hypothetical protein